MHNLNGRIARLEARITQPDPLIINITLSSDEHPTPPPSPGAIVISLPEPYDDPGPGGGDAP